jgi:TPR repeat protein
VVKASVLAVILFPLAGVPAIAQPAVDTSPTDPAAIPPERNTPEAQHLVGIYLLEGEKTPERFAEAARWFHLAAEQNHVPSQLRLASMHALGLGVPQDPVMAYMWYKIASATSGRPLPTDEMNRFRFVARNLSVAQQANADRKVDEWLRTHPALPR